MDGSNEYVNFVATISCLNYNLSTTPLAEFVDNVMYSFTIVFVDRDINKIGWQKMYRGQVKIVCSQTFYFVLSSSRSQAKVSIAGDLKKLERKG